MTDDQRLITKYISRLYPATEALYRIHFLRHEKDEPAIKMLLDNLNDSLRDIKNPVYEELIKEIPNNPNYNARRLGQHVHKKKKSKSSSALEESIPMSHNQISEDQKAMAQFNNLELEDFLETFNKMVSNKQASRDKFYRERIESNLVLQKHREALLLAQKARFSDMAFVAAIAAGEFDTAKEYIPDIIINIMENQQDKKVIATPYEMIHLVLFVLFATSTSKEAFNNASRLFETNFDLPDLRQAFDSFCNNDFSDFMKCMPFLKKTFAYSIYTYPCLDRLVSAITQNIIILHLFPLAKTSIDVIHNQLGISNEEVLFYIRKSIREEKLNGKLNLVSMEYIGSIIIDDNPKEMRQIFEKTMLIRHNFEIDLWVHEFNAYKSPYSKPRK
ncbi:hypothetical protein M9Y10_034732 [Tritrichomonas musculus]|uniref:PCI domain-containing protein n=1 Tax=Tritrichomonas musculus TaxID=1915356 RepID=A0ABR2KFT0_9EUKA